MGSSLLLAHLALAGLASAPLFIHVDPNLNVILIASLTVLVGSWRSIKPSGPTESMSKEHAMRFPLIGSVVLFSLFLVFKFLPKDLVNLVLSGYFVFLGMLAMGATIQPFFKNVFPPKWNEEKTIQFPYVKSLEFEISLSQIILLVPSAFFCIWYIQEKHWLANNGLGLAFSVQGIEMLSVSSFMIGAILLGGLFFYDIFWVFFTPVMVSVAKSFDAPIKLLFPTGHPERPFSLLGLGDIVIPGLFVALALRYDMKAAKGIRYFWSTFGGYVLGLGTTIFVMNYFQAAQPALLYIVPAVLGALAIHAFLNGEISQVLEYDESKGKEEGGEDEANAPKEEAEAPEEEKKDK